MKAQAIYRRGIKLAQFILGLTLLVLIIAWMMGVFRRKTEPDLLPPRDAVPGLAKAEALKTETVHEIVKDMLIEAVGTLKAAGRTEISARVMAPIEEVNVRAGQLVQEGEKLIRLDDRALKTQRSQAQAALVAAEAALRQAENDYRRDRQLLERKAISQAQMDQSTANLEVSRAKLNAAREALAEAEVMLSYTLITAPRAGVVVDRLAEPGDMARPGVPLLVLYDPTSLRLDVPVMENLAVKLKVGESFRVRIDALNMEVEGKIDEIVPQAEAASRSFLVKVALPKQPGMYEGLFGRLLIPAGKRRYLCLPTAAIQTIGQLQFVTVLRPDGRLERRFIQTGRVGMPGRIEVLSGVKAGERVVLVQAPENPLPPVSG